MIEKRQVLLLKVGRAKERIALRYLQEWILNLYQRFPLKQQPQTIDL